MGNQRLIDADALRSQINNGVPLKAFMGRTIDKAYKNLQIILQCIDNAPVVDAVRHGYWIVTHEDDGYGLMRPHTYCSQCGVKGYYMSDMNYCPNCGSKMDVEVKNET